MFTFNSLFLNVSLMLRREIHSKHHKCYINISWVVEKKTWGIDPITRRMILFTILAISLTNKLSVNILISYLMII